MYQNCCKKCGSTMLHTEVKNNNTGLYCNDCGAWIKWLGRDELRAFNNSQQKKDECTKEDSIKNELHRFILFIEKTVDDEYSEMPISEQDAIRKSSYCLGLIRSKNSIINILAGKSFDYREE